VCTGEYIAAQLEELLDKYDLDPIACVTDTDSTEIKAFDLLNEARKRKGKPAMHWLPCFCHLINLVLKAFMRAGSDLYAPLKAIENQLGNSARFTALCTEAGRSRKTVAQSIDIRWASYHNAVASIIELEAQIRLFRPNKREDDTAFERGKELLPILAQFRAVLEAFEGDSPGTIAEVSVELKALAVYLSGIEGTWRQSAQAALHKLALLESKHYKRIYPICWVAARLNPRYPTDDVLGEEEIQAADTAIEAEIADFARQLAVNVRPSDLPPLSDYEQRLAELTAFALISNGSSNPTTGSKVVCPRSNSLQWSIG
jgi:hypothetical protein